MAFPALFIHFFFHKTSRPQKSKQKGEKYSVSAKKKRAKEGLFSAQKAGPKPIHDREMGIRQRYWKSIVLFSFCTPKEGCGSISGWRPITGSHHLIRVCDGTASLAAKSQRRSPFLRSRSFAAAGSLPGI